MALGFAQRNSGDLDQSSEFSSKPVKPPGFAALTQQSGVRTAAKGESMKGARILFGVSIAVLALVSAFIVLVSVQSVVVAFTNHADHLGSIGFDQLINMGAEDAVKAIRGRRVTAATWALAYAVLFAWVVLGPY